MVFFVDFSIAQSTQTGEVIDFPETEITVNTVVPENGDTDRKKLFNFDWRFQLGDFQITDSTPIDDAGWRDLDLPHDWSIEGELDPANPMGNDGGYFPAGIGWYQKHFQVPDGWQEKQVSIYFEGVYMNAEVYINGIYLGKRPYGYSSFSYDLTPYLDVNGENSISVRVDNSQQKNSRWYSGSGIYRNVWLLGTASVHVPHWGVGITTPSVSSSQAIVRVKTLVKNTTDVVQNVTLSTQITSDSSNDIDVQLAPNSEQIVDQEIVVSNPSLWSPESPTRYNATIKVIRNNDVIDESNHPFGVRTIEFSAENGFQLNGKSLLISGGCMHHDNGCLGAAAYNRAEERRVELLKSAGFNAVRTSHNPPSEAFLDACDRLGLLVVDEAFDGWRVSKTPYDYALYFDEWAVQDVQDMVRRDQNHPSIIMWSIGNEIIERTSAEAVTTAKMLADAVKEIDTTRPVTSAMTTWGEGWQIFDPLMAEHDVCGYNYQLHEAENDHARVPSRIIFQSESYPRDAFSNWNLVQQHSYILGDFVWTAMDYLGESGIGRYYYPGELPGEHWEANFYPWHGAYCGDIDLIGHRKPISYYREMLYNDTRKLYMAVREPNPGDGEINLTSWAVWPTWESWTWDGFEGQNIDVEIYSKYPKVRLYLNDVLLGEKNTTQNEAFKATFTVPYQPGTLKAVGIDGGAEVETTTLKTAGPASKVKLTADRSSIQADGQDLVYVTVELTDDEGNVQPNAEDKLVFKVEGGGEIVGVDNANLKDTDPYVATSRKAWKGRALVVIKSDKNGGAITLRVGSGAAADATLKAINLSLSEVKPVFDPNKKEYSVYLPAGTTSVEVTGVPTYSGATVAGNGSVNVLETKSVTLTVTSQDGLSTSDYIVHFIVDVDGFTLMHSYPFSDGTARDTVGSADGTIVGGSVVGGDYIASAQGDYIELPGEKIAINTYASITLEAYVTAGSNNPDYTMLSFFGGTTGAYGTNYFYTTLINGGSSSAAISCGNLTTPWSAETRVNSNPLDNGQPYHLVSTINSERITWYINGVLVGSVDLASNNSLQFLDNSLAYLCKSGYASDASWIGAIDEFNIYKGIMDDQTIAARANSFPTALADPIAAPKQTELSIYPNPVRDILHVVYSGVSEGNSGLLSICNLDGRLMMSEVVSTTSPVELNVRNLPSGTYILKLSNVENTQTEKVFIHH